MTNRIFIIDEFDLFEVNEAEKTHKNNFFQECHDFEDTGKKMPLPKWQIDRMITRERERERQRDRETGTQRDRGQRNRKREK